MEVSRAGVVMAVGATQTLAWASTYYLAAVFADPVSRELHLSRTWFFGVFSGALVLAGVLGPLAGRTIDRQGGRVVLASSNLVFALGLILLAVARGPGGLVAAWVVIGVGMGFGLYEAAFAAVAGLYGREARGAITGITLIAGFASTVGWPASAAMIDGLGWRTACLVWAALHVLAGFPANLLLLRRMVPVSEPPAAVATGGSGMGWTMLLLAGLFTVTSFVSTAYAAHLPGLLHALGSTTAEAIAAASLVGPAQVAARVAEFGLLRRGSALLSARVGVAMHPAGAVLLLLVGAPAAVPFVLLHSGGNGLMTIARGTLPLALFGPQSYGVRMGVLAAPARILQGLAPLAFGLVLEREGAGVALAVSGGLMGVALVALLLLPVPGAADRRDTR